MNDIQKICDLIGHGKITETDAWEILTKNGLIEYNRVLLITETDTIDFPDYPQAQDFIDEDNILGAVILPDVFDGQGNLHNFSDRFSAIIKGVQ
ncbi:MAG: hypothetical protein OEY64_03030 [Nitrospinota bacterium]|nr:hypothetical protein [Nitrospinota bacterium]